MTHCSHGQLEPVADAIWTPLFHNSTSDSEESTRNVAAACLGKLTTTHPSRYLPQLHTRIRDENPAVRATVVSAIRYTFAESASAYDEFLAPLIMDFLSLMKDSDIVRNRSLYVIFVDRVDLSHVDCPSARAFRAKLCRADEATSCSRSSASPSSYPLRGDQGQPGPYPNCTDGSMDAQG